MTTLISYQSSGGDRGRCDSRCYDARESDCDCVCQGVNHGVGRQEAIENTRELGESWLEHARANGQDTAHAEMVIDAMHLPLFDLGGAMTAPFTRE
jgi:hypothetical protein